MCLCFRIRMTMAQHSGPAAGLAFPRVEVSGVFQRWAGAVTVLRQPPAAYCENLSCSSLCLFTPHPHRLGTQKRTGRHWGLRV